MSRALPMVSNVSKQDPDGETQPLDEREAATHEIEETAKPAATESETAAGEIEAAETAADAAGETAGEENEDGEEEAVETDPVAEE